MVSRGRAGLDAASPPPATDCLAGPVDRARYLLSNRGPPLLPPLHFFGERRACWKNTRFVQKKRKKRRKRKAQQGRLSQTAVGAGRRGRKEGERDEPPRRNGARPRRRAAPVQTGPRRRGFRHTVVRPEGTPASPESRCAGSRRLQLPVGLQKRTNSVSGA